MSFHPRTGIYFIRGRGELLTLNRHSFRIEIDVILTDILTREEY